MTASSLSGRLRREWRTIDAMIRLFCSDHAHARPHGGSSLPCDPCARLSDYAAYRLSRCPYGQDKPTCVRCPIHCYRPEEKERARVVMRYAGPRMLLRHPILAILHLVDGRRPVPPLPRRRHAA